MSEPSETDLALAKAAYDAYTQSACGHLEHKGFNFDTNTPEYKAVWIAVAKAVIEEQFAVVERHSKDAFAWAVKAAIKARLEGKPSPDITRL